MPTPDEFPPIVLGIDFGTSNSAVSFWRRDKQSSKIVKFAEKQPVTASSILFHDGFSNYSIGADTLLHPVESELRRIVSHIKPILGKTRIEDVYLFEHMQLVMKDNDRLMVACEDKNEQSRLFSPEDLATLILRSLRQAAIQYLVRKPRVLQLSTTQCSHEVLDANLTRVVIGVPAVCTEKFKLALRAAAHAAGFTEEVHFMVESTAAALSYGLTLAGEKSVMVFDMGGGTTDLTVLDISPKSLDVIWTAGNDHLGGRMVDNLLFHWVLTHRLLPRGFVPDAYKSQDYAKWKNSLLRACKVCKEQLSSEESTILRLPRAALPTLLADQNCADSIASNTATRGKEESSQDIEIAITRCDLEKAIAPALSLVENLVYQALVSLKKRSEPGGTAVVSVSDSNSAASSSQGEEGEHAPLIKEIGKDVPTTNSATTVASSSSLSSGRLVDEVVLAGGCSRIPSVQRAVLAACQRAGLSHIASPNHLCMSLDPETVVAQGLAVQGARLSHAVSDHVIQDLLVFDCLSRTLGLAVWESSSDVTNKSERFFEPMVTVGTKLPVTVRKVFTLHSIAQRFVSLDIYEEFEQVGEDGEVSPVYALFVSLDAPIEQEGDEMSMDHDQEAVRCVEVVFAIDAEQQLSYQVLPAVRSGRKEGDNDKKEGNEDEERVYALADRRSTKPSSSQSSLLLSYIVFLAVVYILCKYVLVGSVVAAHAGPWEAVTAVSTEERERWVASAKDAVLLCVSILRKDWARLWA